MYHVSFSLLKLCELYNPIHLHVSLYHVMLRLTLPESVVADRNTESHASISGVSTYVVPDRQPSGCSNSELSEVS